MWGEELYCLFYRMVEVSGRLGEKAASAWGWSLFGTLQEASGWLRGRGLSHPDPPPWHSPLD